MKTPLSETPLQVEPVSPLRLVLVTRRFWPLMGRAGKTTAYLAAEFASRNVDVTVLIPPGASPHTFEPTPDQYRRFSRTKLFVMVGAGLEFWAEKLIETGEPVNGPINENGRRSTRSVPRTSDVTMGRLTRIELSSAACAASTACESPVTMNRS